MYLTGRRPLPCRTHDPDLWFAENPADLERAKLLCAGCPLRTECLVGALARSEPWGVWGGEILDRGVVIARKRPRGRPRKADLERERVARAAPGASSPAMASWSLVHGFATLWIHGAFPDGLGTDTAAAARTVARHLFTPR